MAATSGMEGGGGSKEGRGGGGGREVGDGGWGCDEGGVVERRWVFFWNW